MKSLKDIEQLVTKHTIKPRSEMRSKALNDALELQRNRNKQRTSDTHTRRTIMNSRITKFAAAAVIIIAVLTGIYQLIDGASVAWAGVAEKVEDIQNYIYRERQTETTSPNEKGFEFVSELEMISYNSLLYGNKTEGYRNEELITLSYLFPQTKEFIAIIPPAKLYERHPLSDLVIREMQQKRPRNIVSRFMSTDYISLGTEVIDRIEVEGIEVIDPKVLWQNPESVESFIAQLWVDVETELPVWLELQIVPKGSNTTIRFVADKFQWNVDFDESDFVPDIPADYKLKSSTPSIEQAQPPTETMDRAEPYLSKFKNLDLPDIEQLRLLGLEDEPQRDIALSGHLEVWQTQDDFIRNWPGYKDVRAELYDELVEKLDIENLSQESLISTGLALREKFWQEGGCLSEASYSFGYASRILLEMAHNKDPENMDIADELVESIMSVELIWQYVEDTNGRIWNPCYNNVLRTLRSAQFDQIRNDTIQGQSPAWKDFVRVNDLAILLGFLKDYDEGLKVVDWLILEAERGGWMAYLNPLKKMQRQYSNGEKFNYNIYVPKNEAFPEEYRYFRRLPSFKGPMQKKRGVIPVHIRNSNPDWTGD
jgi:outer membrane lipoprotein-sorting protein